MNSIMLKSFYISNILYTIVNLLKRSTSKQTRTNNTEYFHKLVTVLQSNRDSTGMLCNYVEYQISVTYLISVTHETDVPLPAHISVFPKNCLRISTIY